METEWILYFFLSKYIFYLSFEKHLSKTNYVSGILLGAIVNFDWNKVLSFKELTF